MAISVEQFVALYGVGEQFTDARIAATLATASSLVERRHGPDYPGAGKLIRCHYNLLYQWQPYLDLKRQAAEVVAVRYEGDTDPADPLSYRLLDGGRILERIAIYWYGRFTVDYQPYDDSGVRNDMLGDIAYQQLQANLAYQQASTPGGSPQMFTELRNSQDLNLGPILSRISVPLMVAELPVRVEVIDDERMG